MIPESAIEPLEMESLADVQVDEETAAAAIATTAVIKLNGGLGTSMGMDRAKSLLCVRRGLSFLDIIARQTLALRKAYGAQIGRASWRERVCQYVSISVVAVSLKKKNKKKTKHE